MINVRGASAAPSQASDGSPPGRGVIIIIRVLMSDVKTSIEPPPGNLQ